MPIQFGNYAVTSTCLYSGSVAPAAGRRASDDARCSWVVGGRVAPHPRYQARDRLWCRSRRERERLGDDVGVCDCPSPRPSPRAVGMRGAGGVARGEGEPRGMRGPDVVMSGEGPGSRPGKLCGSPTHGCALDLVLSLSKDAPRAARAAAAPQSRPWRQLARCRPPAMEMKCGPMSTWT
jgi:hypothetical protein